MELEQEKRQDKVMCDKGTQLQLENIMNFQNFDEIKNWKGSLNTFIMDGRDLGEEFGNVLISQICSEKVVIDWFEHKKSRQCMGLRDYLLQYFVTKFSVRDLSIQMLKDFVVTLKTHFQSNLKFECFMKLCGFSHIMHRPRVDVETYIIKNTLYLKLWQSPKVFYLFVYCCLAIKSMKKCMCDFFTPNHDENSSYLVPVDVAAVVAESALRNFKLPPSIIKDFCQSIPD